MTTRREALATVLLATLLATVLVSGCGTAPTGTSGGSTPPGSPSEPSSSPTPSVEATGPVEIKNLELGLEPVARGFEQPLCVTGAGDGSGRLFVAEQTGRIRVVRDGEVQPGPYLDVSRRITTGGERGLLGLAFSPDYRDSGIFYVNYTDLDGNTVVARFVADDPASDTPKLAGPKAVLRVKQPYANHNGGGIVFEPETERLWVGMGDGGAAGDPENRAQNDNELLGKMLVLDFTDTDAPKPQTIMKGLRNPWRFSFDATTGELWIGDVGQNAWEEIDIVTVETAKGVNWGWPKWEGMHPYPPSARRSRAGYRFPVLEYGHEKGQSVTGGHVYRGTDYPALQGTYLYGDFVSGFVAGIQLRGADGAKLITPRTGDLIESGRVSPSSFGEDDDRELYLCDYSGTLYRVTGTAK